MKTLTMNTANNARQDFFRNIQRQVRQRGVHDVTLKPNGKLNSADVIQWAAQNGYAVEMIDSKIRIGLRKAA